jgi:hypothetical protein
VVIYAPLLELVALETRYSEVISDPLITVTSCLVVRNQIVVGSQTLVRISQRVGLALEYPDSYAVLCDTLLLLCSPLQAVLVRAISDPTIVAKEYIYQFREISYGLRADAGTVGVTHDDNLGDVIGDINKRRGRVIGMNPLNGHKQEVMAEVPMAEMGDFSTAMRSITQGRATFTTEFARYEDAPAPIQQKIIQNAKTE